MTITTENRAATRSPEGTAEHEERCPICGQDGGLWVAKDGHWQVWHLTRLFPCGVYTP